MIKQSITKIKDIQRRYDERRTPLQLGFAIGDSIEFLNADHWDKVALGQSLFLSRRYLRAIESCVPSNIQLRYALIYDDMRPVAILACQIADISGEQFIESSSSGTSSLLLGKVQQRILVCGNLISSGLHGVGFIEGFDPELGWRAVAEALYRIRRADKLNGSIDFAMIKDLKGDQCEQSSILNRYSYRPIKTDPDMVLSFNDDCKTYSDYLNLLNSKYRSRIKKTRQSLLDSGFTIERMPESEVVSSDAQLHALYLEVEKRAPVRLATIASGYFAAMAQALGDNFRCTAIKHSTNLVGFIVTVKDGNLGIAYYVGIDYAVNEQHPIYLSLLQLSVEDALTMGCRKISMGRSALEPKANLGAKPVETQVWMRHRISLVNFTLRKFFPIIPYDEAPERNAFKELVE